MISTRFLHKLFALTTEDLFVLLEAGGWLLWYQVRLYFASRRGENPLCRLVNSGEKSRRGGGRVDDKQLVWAVQTASSRLPLLVTCLARALAIRKMLVRRKVENTLFVGVHKSHREDYQFHAWVVKGGEVLIGENNREYQVLLELTYTGHFPYSSTR